jgi:prepilin-type N-terminal cleavage/methylation domain-containing protein
MRKTSSKISRPKIKLAFSLIELSIVILIISIIAGGALTISKSSINSSKKIITKERMDEVYKALASFVAINRRLPCPALLSVAKTTSTYGDEDTTAGTCDNLTVATSTNLVYGMVPIKALGLEPDMAEDGWGTKFSYVVDKRFTKASVDTSSTDGFEITQAIVPEEGSAISPTLIDVQGPSGTSLLDDINALFVLISHGANKYGGWNATNTTQNGDSLATTDEQSNTGSASGGSDFDKTFISYSTDPDFDDIILYSNKPKLLRDAGLEYIMCNAAEAETTYSWTTNGNYGCAVCSNTANYARQCGKYGIWGAQINTTCTADTEVCPQSFTDPDMVIYADQKTNADGGTFTSGSWQTRTINTTLYEKDDSGSFSLSSNQITLQPGRYFIEAKAESRAVYRNVLRFYNTSDSAVAIQGNSVYSKDDPVGQETASISGVIDIASAKTFEIQHQCQSTSATNGFGIASGFTTDNIDIYLTVTITKLL